MGNEEHNTQIEEQMDTGQKVQTRIIFAFGVIAFLLDFTYSTYQSAAEDILEATDIPTTWISLALAAPACLIAFTYPYAFQRIPYSVACSAIFIASVAGVLLTSLVQDFRMRVAGVCLASFGIGCMETMFLSLSSLYGEGALHSFSLCSSLGFLLGPLSYTGLTMFACWSPHVSLLSLAALWILFPISCILIKGLSNSHDPTSFKDVPYIPVESNSAHNPGLKLSCREMLILVWKTQKLFIPLFVGIFCRTLMVGSVVTSIAFTNIPLTSRNQYLLYISASGIGELLGRPYLGYLSLCGIKDKFIVMKTWILSLLQTSIVMFASFDSWFRMTSEIYFVLALVTCNTFLQGVLFVNSFLHAGEGLSMEEKRFCRALLTGAIWSANISAGLIGLHTETQLRIHCLLFRPEAACYTRSYTAWNRDVSCVL